MQFLTIWDLLLTPFYLLVLVAIAKRNRDKKYPAGHPLHRYYLSGLYIKFAGAIFIALIYAYYYKGGDTFNFFHHAQIVNSSIEKSSLEVWFKLMAHTPVSSDPKLYEYTSQLEWYGELSTYNIVRITAIFGLLTANTYLPIALLFAYFSFTGIWAMFRTIHGIFPHLTKELAIAFLFIPSVVIWGSAVFKDTVCLAALGWLTYSSFRLFVSRDFSPGNLFILAISFILIASIKVYILMAFVPALGAWISLSYTRNLPSAPLRWLVNLGLLFVIVTGFLFFSQMFASELNRYSLDKLASTANTTRNWISFVSQLDQGSSYDLGSFDPTPAGMLSKFPQAVVVTLFRPFPWEARKVIVFLSALEAMAFVYFTFLALKKRGSFRLIIKNPTVLFCLIFSLIFAFAVGISSYNFGALSRYKIPCLPFYAAFLMILIHYNKEAQSPLHEKRRRKVSALA